MLGTLFYGIALFITLCIAGFSARVYYFSKDKKYIAFSFGFLLLSLAILVKLLPGISRMLLLPTYFPIIELLYKILFILFIFLVSVATLKPKTRLEWMLLIYVLLTAVILSYRSNFVFYLSTSLLLLLIALCLLDNFFKNKDTESFLTFLSFTILTASFILYVFISDVAQWLEISSFGVLLVYLIILITLKKEKKGKTKRRKEGKGKNHRKER